MKTYALATLGCKVNQYESRQIERALAGLRRIDFGLPADLAIINACGVTAEAEAKARGLVRKARRASPAGFIALVGCWAAEKRDDWQRLGVDLFADNYDKSRLAELLPDDLRPGPAPAEIRRSRTRAFVKIQDGCDQFCAYCAVPLYRPTLASRPLLDIVAEIKALCADGVKEAVLTGVHLGKYGVDLNGKRLLLPALLELLDQTALPRLRLSSLEPQEIDDSLIELIKREPRIARHLHIPLQSGSDRVLAKMNRPYNSDDFLSLANRVRAAMPDIGLTTDIIVGFPGESPADFQATRSLLAAAAFSRVHVFRFSPRPGTAAANLPDRPDERTVKERSRELIAIGAEAERSFARRFIGKTVTILVERAKDHHKSGLTGEYVRVKFNDTDAAPGDLLEAVGIETVGETLIVRCAHE